MHTKVWIVASIALALIGLAIVEWPSTDPCPATEAQLIPGIETRPIVPIPEAPNFDERLVDLGRRLFHEERLSADGTISCASCHPLSKGGVDGLRVSVGVGGSRGESNAPTVLNSGLNFRHHWDGRSMSLEDQIDGPLTHPKEMGSNWERVLAVLASDSDYVSEFQAIWGDGITVNNVKQAIATFERTLVTPDSPFDHYINGQTDAISEDAIEGYQLFQEIGCISCHQGVNVGGNLFQRFGIASNFFEDRGSLSKVDLGRYNLTQRDEDVFKFRVPSLRNVAETAPYLHDGSIPTLEGVVRIMAKYQLGAHPSDEDVNKIVAFLKTLSGRQQE